MADKNMSHTKRTSQTIDNLSFDEELGVKVTEIIGADGVLKNPATEETLQKLQGFQIPSHDFIEYGYTGSDITTITYKTGGSGGTTVATVSITYLNGNPLTKTLTL